MPSAIGAFQLADQRPSRERSARTTSGARPASAVVVIWPPPPRAARPVSRRAIPGLGSRKIVAHQRRRRDEQHDQRLDDQDDVDRDALAACIV